MSGEPRMVFARVPFDYMTQPLERGEILALRGSPRDDQLLGLKYFVLYDKKEYGEFPCLNCGKKFATEGFYLAHKRKNGGCLAPSQPITDAEASVMVGRDIKSVD